MKIIGRSHGEVMLNGNHAAVFQYFSDHKKILSYNPLCKNVSNTAVDNVYQWDFEITDPRAHPIRLVFFVEQVCEKNPVTPPQTASATLTDDIASSGYSQILWSSVPVEVQGEMPDDHTFIGEAQGKMDLKTADSNHTVVDVVMQVSVDFHVPILLRVFPEAIIRTMAESAMSFGMRRVSDQMLAEIQKDFACAVLSQTASGAVN
jgi:hypothetical protein